jgi:hypothetical protein
MRNRLNLIIRDLDRVRSLNHNLSGITRTIDLNLEAKFQGNLFNQVDQGEKTWRQIISLSYITYIVL